MRHCLALLMIAAFPGIAQAQMEPSAAYQSRRENYLADSAGRMDELQSAGARHMATQEGVPSQWWSGWAAQQPYDQTSPGQPAASSTTASASSAQASLNEPKSDDPFAELPTGPSEANRSDAPVEPLPVERMTGQAQ